MLAFSRDFAFDNTPMQQRIMGDALDTIKEEKESGRVGYYTLPETSLHLIDELNAYSDANTLLSEGKIKDIVIIGIGGSSLGIKAIDSLLARKNDSPVTLHFFENSDPVNISQTLNKLDKESSLFIVISKSGGTIETTSIFKTVIAYFNLDLDGSDRERVMAITDAGSSLSQFAESYNIKQFNIPDNVGGRFSVLSAVGIVPLTLAGYDTNALLNGAGAFLESLFAGKEVHLLEKACYYYENAKAHSINVLFSYANDLENLTKWYVQLWGESLGKIDSAGNSVGMTPIGLIGAVDQHSFLQLVIEGPKDKTVTFINIDDFENDLTIPEISLKHIEKTDFINGKTFNELINAQCDATRQSLINNNVPTDGIALSKINEENIGAMIIYYELLTSLTGAMLNINTYDQPGVELGKTILYANLNK
jgi:glucose-6-phosphate isomerase